MDRAAADPANLLAVWMEWERGEVAPGRTLSNLKIAGMREVLESLAAEGGTGAEPGGAGPSSG